MTLAYHADIVQTISYAPGQLWERLLALLRVARIKVLFGLAMQMAVPVSFGGANAPRSVSDKEHVRGRTE